MKENQLTIRFGGDGNIRVETLTAFLDEYKSLLYEINNEYGYSPDDLVITVSPPENGSFKISISPRFKNVMLASMGTLVASTLSGLLVYHLTKPSEPASITDIKELLEQHSIHDAEVPKYVHKLYHNSGSNQRINQTFIIVQDDPNVTEITVDQNDQKVLQVLRSELDSAIDRTPVEEAVETEQIEVETKEVTLVLKTVHFEGKAKWGFIYRGYPIKAIVRDSVFMESLGAEAFRKGDTMKALLSTRKIYDADLDTYIVDTKSYAIEKVVEHRAKGEDDTQTSIVE